VSQKGDTPGAGSQTVQVEIPCAKVRTRTQSGIRPTKGVIDMRKIVLAVLGASVLLQPCSGPAYALSARTWVSHTGNDGNPCSESSPCLTFSGALAQTSDGGMIQCLDSGDYAAPFVIAMSVTIDCRGTNASTLDFSTGNGIDINVSGGVVILRGLVTTGVGAGTNIGINIIAAGAVYIENCAITGFRQGISDVRTTGFTLLFIKNTVVQSNVLARASPGILLAAAPKNSVVLENVQSLGNSGYGIAVATGNNVVISRSVFSGNGIAGIEADPGSTVVVDNSEITHNAGYGIFALGTVALSNSDISFNTSSISGATMSYGNNRFLGNGGGTAPTPAGGASTDFGQQ
jgi:hypothetical protein